MITFETSTRINRPIEEVVAYASDPATSRAGTHATPKQILERARH